MTERSVNILPEHEVRQFESRSPQRFPAFELFLVKPKQSEKKTNNGYVSVSVLFPGK